jgi:hypothetical protein
MAQAGASFSFGVGVPVEGGFVPFGWGAWEWAGEDRGNRLLGLREEWSERGRGRLPWLRRLAERALELTGWKVGFHDGGTRELPRQLIGTRVYLNMFSHTSVWLRVLQNNCAAVALFNAGDRTQSIEYALAKLQGTGWDRHTRVSVRDLWAHADLPPAIGFINATVGSHATFLAKLCKM